MMNWTVWTDGSGQRGGPAGVGFYAEGDGGAPFTGSLPLADATNQQAEILAAAYALHQLPEGSVVKLISDSEYVVRGWNEYIPMWRRNGWLKKDGGVPKNLAHWRRLAEAVERHMLVSFEWVEGHTGIYGNEEADRLAGEARQAAKAAAA
jgi:ribonuclease HI